MEKVQFDYEEVKKKCLDFLKYMQDYTKNLVLVDFINSYEDDYEGVVIGKITDILDLKYTVTPAKYFTVPSNFVSVDYAGAVSGTHTVSGNLDAYEIQQYLFTDTYYFIQSAPLKSDGTWSLPKPVEAGIKEYRLVLKDSGDILSYGRPYINEFVAKVIVLSDVEYEVGSTKVWADDFSFYYAPVPGGKKVARIVEVSTKEIVGDSSLSSSAFVGKVPSSYLVPENDPQYNKEGNTANGQYGYKLQDRVFIYDIGLSLIVFTLSGDYDRCKLMLDRMAFEQADNGSWNFSYDKFIGRLFHDYIRTGAIGWLGWGMCYYALNSGDSSYNEVIEKGCDYILSRQVTDTSDLRYGLLRGGYGAYDGDYGYDEFEIEWCSTEHNCSSLQYIWGTYWLTGKEKYRQCALLIEKALKEKVFDEANGRYYQGVSKTDIDKAWALDCTTWAGMAGLSFYDINSSNMCQNTAIDVYHVEDTVEFNSEEKHFNMTYKLNSPVGGFMPYSDITEDYAGCPRIVWTEGTLGAVALLLKLGRTEEAYYYLDETIKLQNMENCKGGIVYVTETWAELPWEFHVWESVISTAWLYICLTDVNAIWSFHGKQILPANASRDGRLLKAMVGKRINVEGV